MQIFKKSCNKDNNVLEYAGQSANLSYYGDQLIHVFTCIYFRAQNNFVRYKIDLILNWNHEIPFFLFWKSFVMLALYNPKLQVSLLFVWSVDTAILISVNMSKDNWNQRFSMSVQVCIVFYCSYYTKSAEWSEIYPLLV